MAFRNRQHDVSAILQRIRHPSLERNDKLDCLEYNSMIGNPYTTVT